MCGPKNQLLRYVCSTTAELLCSFHCLIYEDIRTKWVQLQQRFWDLCVHCFAKYLRTSGPNEFNYCRAFKIFVSIALLNLWGHRDQMCSTTLERLRSFLLLIKTKWVQLLQSFWHLCVYSFAKYMKTSGPNEFNYCRAFEIFVSIALLNIWGHQDQMSPTTAERLRSLFPFPLTTT
jgi:hypothetical protein